MVMIVDVAIGRHPRLHRDGQARCWVLSTWPAHPWTASYAFPASVSPAVKGGDHCLPGVLAKNADGWFSPGTHGIGFLLP